MHYLLGNSGDYLNDFLINLGRQGIARLNLHCVKQAEPITPEILLKFASHLNFSNTTDKVFWCLFLFAFFSVCTKI